VYGLKYSPLGPIQLEGEGKGAFKLASVTASPWPFLAGGGCFRPFSLIPTRAPTFIALSTPIQAWLSRDPQMSVDREKLGEMEKINSLR